MSKLFLFIFLLYGHSVLAFHLGHLPVQSSGRIKAFDTLARESLQSIYGRQSFKGQPAHFVVGSWFLAPEAWLSVPLFHISNFQLRQVLELKNPYATWQQLVSNAYLPLKLQQLQQKKDNNEKLNPFDQALQNLQYGMQLFVGLQSGVMLRIEPRQMASGAGRNSNATSDDRASGGRTDVTGESSVGGATMGATVMGGASVSAWRSVNELTPDTQLRFRRLVQSFVQQIKNTQHNKDRSGLQYDKPQTDQHQSDASQVDQSQANQSHSDQSHSDQSQTDPSQADKSTIVDGVVKKQSAAASIYKTGPDFIQYLKKTYGSAYANLQRIQVELLYNTWRPFLMAWIFYLLGLLLMWGSRFKPPLYIWSLGCSAIGLLLHIAGLLARVYIVQRPPVTNMYETVVWVALGAMLFALYLQHAYRGRGLAGQLQSEQLKSEAQLAAAGDLSNTNYLNGGGQLNTTGRVVMLAAGTLSTLCLILTDLSAQVLDARLDPLEPVLRDNFWLLTHVLVITLSYAAFFLAMVVGHILLWGGLKNLKINQLLNHQGVNHQGIGHQGINHQDTNKHGYNNNSNNQKTQSADTIPLKRSFHLPATGLALIYQLIKVGVVLLSVGIILGGLWADVSWGRFWGWDPKETWALIALLGYIAWLHGRMTGWLRALGQVVGVIVAFNLVIMAWYGVNFVLGAGLHTYGFGAGGLEWVLAFVMLQLVFVGYVLARAQNLKP